MALCGLDLSLAAQPLLLSLAGFTGMMCVSGRDLGPCLAVEQTVLAQTSDASRRNRVFARYSFTGGLAGAAGGFAAGLSETRCETHLFFGLFAGLGLATAGIPSGDHAVRNSVLMLGLWNVSLMTLPPYQPPGTPARVHVSRAAR
jgi:hypothetical protein